MEVHTSKISDPTASISSTRTSPRISAASYGRKRKIQETKNTTLTASGNSHQSTTSSVTSSGTTPQTKETAETSSKSQKCKKLSTITGSQYNKGALRCVAILPGIGPFWDSSDSENSSASEEESDTFGKYDLVGRKINKIKQCKQDT